MSEAVVLNYSPGGPTVARFHESEAFVRGIMGPIGSSKSTACVMEILSRAAEQRPSPDGVRRSRWAIVRNSYPELKTTTIKTWTQWCPAQYGRLTFDSPITHHIKAEGLDIEVLFIALDKPDDVRKVLSLELTGVWFNEAREIPKAIVDAMTGRVGRYPNKQLVPPDEPPPGMTEEEAIVMVPGYFEGGCTWSGILMDTNPPPDDSWWHHCAEDETPEGWAFFQQPSGRSAEAENLRNLPRNYYVRIMAGKDPDWVKVYVDGEYGFVSEGKPVYPMYRDRIHCAPSAVEPLPDIALTIGVDFGLTPAAVIGQKLPDGRWIIIDEVVTDNCGVTRFGETLSKYLAAHYPNHDVAMGWGDPAGSARDGDERTSFELLNAVVKFQVKPAPDNDLTPRIEVVIGALNRLVDGEPGFLLSPNCKKLRKGFVSGYHYRSVRTGNGETFHDKPAKNDFSHPHDALQYLLLGGGEYDVVINRVKKKRAANAGPRLARDLDYSPLE